MICSYFYVTKGVFRLKILKLIFKTFTFYRNGPHYFLDFCTQFFLYFELIYMI